MLRHKLKTHTLQMSIHLWTLLFSKESFVFLSCCHAAVYSFSMPTGYRGYHDTCSDLACNCYVQHLGRLFFGMSRNMVSTSTEHQVKPFWAQVQLAFTCSKSALSGLNTLKVCTFFSIPKFAVDYCELKLVFLWPLDFLNRVSLCNVFFVLFNRTFFFVLKL